METNNINFNQIDFGRLEPNSLYAVKFPNLWYPEDVCEMIGLLNEIGSKYGTMFAPFIDGMEIVNCDNLLDNQIKP